MVNASRWRFNANIHAANLKYCKIDYNCGRKNAESLGRVRMKLMDKDAKENGELGLTRIDQWSELAVNFLSMTTNNLKQVCFQDSAL